MSNFEHGICTKIGLIFSILFPAKWLAHKIHTKTPLASGSVMDSTHFRSADLRTCPSRRSSPAAERAGSTAWEAASPEAAAGVGPVRPAGSLQTGQRHEDTYMLTNRIFQAWKWFQSKKAKQSNFTSPSNHSNSVVCSACAHSSFWVEKQKCKEQNAHQVAFSPTDLEF